MTDIQVHNTLTGKIENFVPQKAGEVRMYTCGPTVYDYAHIGNYRTFVFQDILRRFLKLRGFKLKHVMNLTDVDDRIIANAAAAGVSIRDYTAKFVQAFFDDCKTLSIEEPEHWVRATDNIDEMVKLIQRLQEKSFTYPGEGSIYYRIAKFPEYGKLSKIDLTGIQAGARVDNDRYEKESARDFALWKAPKPGEHFWATAIGPGRPGWHIECSAMAMKYLGETLDIHTGGIDLAFPHHENEIAQSEGATGKPFSRYWLHAEHLLVEGEKMSKSQGNFFTLRDLFAKGYKPSALRFALASVPYRKQLNFTFDGLQQAASSAAWGLRTCTDRWELDRTNSSTLVSAISRPLPITSRWSAVRAISLIRWLETSTVRPSAASARMRVLTQWMPSGSRPFAGSSKMSTWVSAVSHLPTTTFCWLPPDRLRTRCWRPGVRIRSALTNRLPFSCVREVRTQPRRPRKRLMAVRTRLVSTSIPSARP